MPGHDSAGSGKRQVRLQHQTEVQLEIFKRFVETSGQALGMADLEGRIFFANSTLCRMLGRDNPEAVYRHDLFAFYPPETARRLREEILPSVLREGQWVGELSLVDAQGRVTPTIENIFLLRDEKATPLCFATVFTDLSERIRLEQELNSYRHQLERLVAERTLALEKTNVQLMEEIVERRRSEKEHTRLREILDSTSDLVGAAFSDGQGMYMNAAGRRMAGFGADEDLSKRNMSEVHPAWSWPYVENVGIPTAITKGVWEGETVIVNHATGKEIPVSQVIMAHRSPEGEIDFISTIIRDISERKRMEEALRESEERFRSIVDNMQDAFFRCDLNGELLYTTASAARLLGCPSPEEMIGLKVKDFHYCPEDADKQYEILQAQGKLTQYELTLKRRDNGQPIVVSANVQFYRDREGSVIGIEGVYRDITKHKQDEEEIRKSEEKYRRIVDTANEGIWMLDADLRTTFVNACSAELIGYQVEEIVGRKFDSFLFEEDRADHEKKMEARRQGFSGRYERRIRHKDGHALTTFISAAPIFDTDRQFQGSFAMITDITDRKRTEEELHKMASVITHCSELVNLANPDWKMTYLNEAGMRMLGVSADEIKGMDITQVIPDHLLEKVRKEVLPAMREGGWEGELEYKNLKTGALTAVYATIFLVKDPETGAPLYHANVSLDINARKQAEEALRESEQRFRGLSESIPQLVEIIGPDGSSIYHNPQFVEYTGLRMTTAEERWRLIHPEDRPLVEKAWRQALLPDGSYHSVYRLRRHDGEYHWFLVRIILMRAADDTLAGWLGTATDIDDLIRTEQTLKESVDMLAEAERIGHMGSWRMDLSRNTFTMSSGMRMIMGFTGSEPITFESIQTRMYPGELDDLLNRWLHSLEERLPFTAEYRVILPDGSIRHTRGSAEASFDPQGKPLFLHGTIQDITERRALEDELIKAQKLDSIGTLAGGLAHDYNNLLTAIMGNIELANTHIAKDNQAQGFLAKARNAAMTARDLTRQLVTFSQGGYPHGTVMPIDELLKESARLGLSGSNTKTAWRIADDLPEVKIDANQIRQVIYNIVINAQEAMPQGGTLFIVADKTLLGPDNPMHLPEGIYVRLAFRDEGRGITAENLPKVFDPYFTTKDMGSTKGIGLGLSICYSIIKRHGGHIIVESTVGIGTTVTVYLPKGYV